MDKESNVYDMNALYTALTDDRENLPSVLSKINDYYVLKDIITSIEKKYEDNYDIWRELCIGKVGDSSNAFSAICEIPTKQLINSISLLFQMYDIRNIDEVGAGMGLLTRLLQEKFDEDNYKVKLLASDDGSSDITNISLDFTRIIKKDVSDIILQHNMNIDPPEGIICCWPLESMTNQFIDLIKTQFIKLFVFTVEIRSKYILSKEFNKIALECGYKVIKLPILQSSYLDIHKLNQFENLYTRSITFVLIRKDLADIDIFNLLSEYIYEYKEIDSKKIMLQDMAITKNLPFWICTLDNDIKLNVSMEIYNSILTNVNIYEKKIPDWILNLDLLIFWYERTNKKKFPLKINTSQKLEEYYDKVTNMTPEKILSLKKDKILPEWVPENYVDLYFWLLYSVPESDNDKWKENIVVFNHKFNQVYGYRADSAMYMLANIFKTNNLFGDLPF